MSKFFERVVYAMLEAEADLDPMSARTVLIAALRAMREPTGSMIDAVSNRIIPPTETMRAGMRAAVVSDWQAMIDQAIKEGE